MQKELMAMNTPSCTAISAGLPTAQELMVYQTWAKNAADSQMYRTVGKESAIMMIMLAAREYGIGPAQALNGGLHIIEGKVELSARVMSALIRRAKHTLQILESTDQVCRIKGIRADTNETHTVEYTIDMAQKAGLIKEKGGWKRNPEDMLYARCISRLARQLFSDVVGISYVEGEIIDSRSNGEVLEAFPETNAEPHDQDLKFEELFNMFGHEDRPLLEQFLKQVMQHYKMTKYEALKEMLGDEKGAIEMFNNWKKKRNDKVTYISPTTE